MSDIRTLYAYVQQALEDEGFADVASAELVVDGAFYPFFYQYGGGKVYANELPPDEDGLRRIIDRSDRILGGGVLAPVESLGGTAAAAEALRVWALAAAAHELCHHVQQTRATVSAKTGSIYAVEAECHLFEVAMVDRAIARGDAPPHWRALFRRFVVMSGSMAAGFAPPPAGTSPGAAVDGAWPATSRSWHDSRGEAGFAAYEDVAIVTAFLTTHRLAVIDGTPAPTFGELAAIMGVERQAPTAPAQPAPAVASSDGGEAPVAAVRSTRLPDGSLLACPDRTRLRGRGDLAGASAAFCERESDRRRHGPFASWFVDGARKARGAYADGRFDGEWTVWYPDGTVQAKGTFAHGIRDGHWVHHRPDATIMWEGDIVGGAVRGRRERLTIALGTGAAAEVGVVDGVLDGSFVVESEGDRRVSGTFTRGFPDGTWLAHDLDRFGRVWFVDGLPVEVTTGWTATRKPQVEGRFDRGLPHGRWRIHDQAGELVAEQTYDHGLPTGTWTRRDGGGRTIESRYRNGWLVSGPPASVPPWREPTTGIQLLADAALFPGDVPAATCARGPTACALLPWLADGEQMYFMRGVLYLAGGSGNGALVMYPPPGPFSPEQNRAHYDALADVLCRSAREPRACAYAAELARRRARKPAELETAAGLALLGCETESSAAKDACAVVTAMIKARQVSTRAIDRRGYVEQRGCRLGSAATCAAPAGP